jgi:ABC-type antimicrobial peptide transport system permease subunit
VLRQSLGMIVVGVVLGAIAALAAMRVLERTVDGMRGADPLTVALMSAVLMAAALFASFLPARRAGRIEPMRALRED